MSSCRVLLLTLALLGVPVESWSSSRRDLTDLYNSRVERAERVVRPFGNFKKTHGVISHSGVRVTLEDGSQWLIHKGRNFGISSDTVVVDDDHMSSRWRTEDSREFNGRKTVADFVRVGGEKYGFFKANCHHASKAMMKQ